MLKEISLGKEPLDLDLTFNSGQIFRWWKSDGWWQGWIKHSMVAIRKKDGLLQFRSAPEIEGDDIRNFFSLQVEYETVVKSLPDDEFTGYLVKKYSGLKILRQNYWECSTAYIISSSLSIQVINGILDKISLAFTGDSKGPFPNPKQLLKMKRPYKNFLGKKWRYLTDLANRISQDEFDFKSLEQMSYESAWKKLVIEKPHCSGIGPKVADCILLFAAAKYNSFPMDRWVLRGLRKYYKVLTGKLDTLSDALTVKKYEELSNSARQYFGKYSGFLQEYLFVHQRGLI